MKPSSRSRERGRERRLRAALGLLAFAISVLVGGVALLTRAVAVGGSAGPLAVVTHDALPAKKSRCTKARSITHAKHLRPHSSSASVDDDDDDDDDGVADAFTVSFDEPLAVLPPPYRAVPSALPALEASVYAAPPSEPDSCTHAPYPARGPPRG